MKKIAFSFLIISFPALQGISQPLNPLDNINAPRVIPAPPNASALTKFSGVDVALNTGMVKFDIPLYNLSAGKLSLPISLSYASNGIRVNEYPSLTGMSWVLNAGGVITRTVYGAIDETATRRTIADNVPSTSQQMLDFILQYNNQSWNDANDTEADVFSFNFLGYNGKFVLDENGIPVLLPYSNIKIETNFSSSVYTFKITDASGIKYYFGGVNATEKTWSNNTAYAATMPHPDTIKTSFYINKIESPNGDVINFQYNEYIHDADPQDITQTNTHFLTSTNCSVPGCTCPCPSQISFVRNYANYKSRILSEINVQNWGKVIFSYESYNIFSLTNSNGAYKLLTGIIVKDNNNVSVKSISLLYDYHNSILYSNGYSGCPTSTKRAFLKEVNSGSDKYQFEYYSPDQLPVIASFSQDHWGFYNGVYNTTFISNFGNPSLTAYPQATADRNPNPLYAGNGLLKKITHPTGGAESIEYEGNVAGTTVKGGMRVKKISVRDAENASPIIRRIYYGPSNSLNSNSGLAATPWFDKTITNGTVCYYANQPNFPHPYLLTCEYSRRTSNTVNNLGIFNGGIIAYSAVTESIGGDNFENGGIEHHYRRSANSYSYPLVNGNPFDGPMNYSTRLHGVETYTKIFKKSGSTEIRLSETFNYHSLSPLYSKEVKSLNVVARWIYVMGLDFSGFDVNKTMYESWWETLDRTETITYDENGQNPLTTNKYYYYENLNHLQPTKIVTTDSKGNTVEARFKYPVDFANPSNPNIYDDMLSKNMKAIPLQKTDYRAASLLSDIKLSYRTNNQFPVPDIVESSLYGNALQQELLYNMYDTKGNLLQFTARDGVTNSFIYDHYSFLPVAEIKNAPQNLVAFTSFEADGTGGWSYSGPSTPDNTAPTGKKVYNLTNYPASKSTLDQSKTYIVSYWSKNGPQNANSTSSVTGESIGSWTYYEHKVANPSNGTITVSGSGTIDELRLYPAKALMTTYTYQPLIGISTVCDPNNRISYYEYDGFSRLSIIRDQYKRIIKKICYNYAGQPENCQSPCTYFEPDWQNIGTPSCQQNACGNTGYQSQQQQDMNPCNNGNTRELIIYNPSACPPATGVFITYQAISFASGFTAVYTNNSTQQTYNFPIPTGSGTLGCIPAGIYSLSISKPGNNWGFYFGNGCFYITGTSAFWGKVNVSSTTCNTVTIELEQQ